jgi:hypothetical protein
VCDRTASSPKNPTHPTLRAAEIPSTKWGTYKRLELLIEAFEHVAMSLPNLELIIGGGDHPKPPATCNRWRSVMQITRTLFA